jgi:hypothetical protein
MYKKTNIMNIPSFLKTNVIGIVAVLFAISLMSFSIWKKDSASITYFYNSSDISAGAFAEPSHWQTTNASACEEEGERPCSIVVPDGQTLNDVLSGKTNSQVLSMSPNRKP